MVESHTPNRLQYLFVVTDKDPYRATRRLVFYKDKANLITPFHTTTLCCKLAPRMKVNEDRAALCDTDIAVLVRESFTAVVIYADTVKIK